MSPHPSYKLYYFPGRGRAEIIRYIFAYAEVPFEDVRLEREVFKSEYKPKFPFGQVPVLDIDGKHMLAQSHSIARYLANEFHMTGANHFEAALVDMYVDGLSDLKTNMRPAQRAKNAGDENAGKEEWAKFKAEHFTPFLDRYEKVLAGNDNEHLVGSKTTWADLVIAEFLEGFQISHDAHALDSHPKLAKFVEKVLESPGIKRYISGRPKTAH